MKESSDPKNRQSSEAEKHSIQCVGMVCNVSLQQDLNDKFISWICRSWVMDKAFKKENLQLFMYSPKLVDPNSGMAKGYTIENNQFVLREREVPSLNYDWYFKPKVDNGPGMSYRDFYKWVKTRNIVIFPIEEIIRIAVDKYKTYLLIKKYNPTIQPESEIYDRDINKLKNFFNKNNLVFLKPIYGGHGEGIITIEKDVNKRGLVYYLFNQYLGVERQEFFCISWKKLVDILNERISNRDYIIQVGVKSLRYKGSAFNIRVIMVNDGEAWQWAHEVRAATHFSAISTYPFLGKSYPLKDLLPEILSEKAVKKLMEDLHFASFGLIQYLDTLYPGTIGELAFDFVVDEECQVYLAEINTKPGVIGDPNVLQDFFNIPSYGEQTERYLDYLAKLFKKKSEQSLK